MSYLIQPSRQLASKVMPAVAAAASSTAALGRWSSQNLSSSNVSYSTLSKPSIYIPTAHQYTKLSSSSFTPIKRSDPIPYPVTPFRAINNKAPSSDPKRPIPVLDQSRDEVLADVAERTHSKQPYYDDPIDSSDSKRYPDRIATKSILNEKNFLKDGDRVIVLGGANGQVAKDALDAANAQGVKLAGVISLDVREESMEKGRTDLEKKGSGNVDFYLANAFVERDYHSHRFEPKAERNVYISLLPPVTDEAGNRKLLHAPNARKDDVLLYGITLPEGMKYRLHANKKDQENSWHIENNWHILRNPKGVPLQAFTTEENYAKIIEEEGFKEIGAREKKTEGDDDFIALTCTVFRLQKK